MQINFRCLPAMFLATLLFSVGQGAQAQNYISGSEAEEMAAKERAKRRALESDPTYIAQKVNTERVDDFFKAVRIDNARAVQDLIERGFKPNTVEPHSGFPPLVLALFLENYQVAKVLIDNKAVDVELENQNGENALMMASIKGQLDLVRDLIIKRKAELGRRGWTALHYAASQGQLEVMRLLIEEGAYVDAPAPNQNTPLMMATILGSHDAVQLLIEQGADPLLKNRDGLSAEDWAARSQNKELLEYLAQAKRDYEYKLASAERAKRAAALAQAAKERQEREALERVERERLDKERWTKEGAASESPINEGLPQENPVQANLPENSLTQQDTILAVPANTVQPPPVVIVPALTVGETPPQRLSISRYSLPASAALPDSVERPLRYNPIPPPAVVFK